MQGVRITRLRITNFRGIETFEMAIPPAGAVLKGPNGAGKTSVLNAIRAALSAQGIAEDAIRHGAERAEILINLDASTVRRIITRKGTQLGVSTDAGEVRAPQRWLNELLGEGTFDPLAFYQLKPRDRRTAILAALPIRVTREQIVAALPDWACASGTLSDYLAKCDFVASHGLEVCADVGDILYRWRTDLNATAKRAEADALTERSKLLDLDTAVPLDAKGLVVADEQRALDAAVASVRDLEARQQGDQKEAIRMAGVRARIDTLEAQARDDETAADTISDRDALIARWAEKALVAKADVDVARHALEKAERAWRECEAERTLHTAAATTRANHLAAAARTREFVRELEGAMNASGATPVTPEQLELARTAARRLLERTGVALRAETARAQASIAKDKATAAEETRARAGKLTDLVVLFRDALPASLMSTGSIQGLRLEGDDILLDGTPLDSLCGQEQLLFAVELARRVNAKSKILVIDGLERLDPAQYSKFVQVATRDGYQLIGTRVEQGEVVLEAIELDAA